jgi:hypothetical protein
MLACIYWFKSDLATALAPVYLDGASSGSTQRRITTGLATELSDRSHNGALKRISQRRFPIVFGRWMNATAGNLAVRIVEMGCKHIVHWTNA